MQKDLKENAYGREQGRKERLNPTGRSAADVCYEKYGVEGINEKYR